MAAILLKLYFSLFFCKLTSKGLKIANALMQISVKINSQVLHKLLTNYKIEW